MTSQILERWVAVRTPTMPSMGLCCARPHRGLRCARPHGSSVELRCARPHRTLMRAAVHAALQGSALCAGSSWKLGGSYNRAALCTAASRVGMHSARLPDRRMPSWRSWIALRAALPSWPFWGHLPIYFGPFWSHVGSLGPSSHLFRHVKPSKTLAVEFFASQHSGRGLQAEWRRFQDTLPCFRITPQHMPRLRTRILCTLEYANVCNGGGRPCCHIDVRWALASSFSSSMLWSSFG